jgi:hypothetical protein
MNVKIRSRLRQARDVLLGAPPSRPDVRELGRKEFLRRVIPQGGVGAEIGVHKGEFTRSILEVARPATLHLIDPWYVFGKQWTWGDGDRSTMRALTAILGTYEEELVSGKLVLNIGDDIKILPTFPDQYFDWVYLDSSHEYEHTLKELELLKIKVKADGVIAGDDWIEDPNDVNHGVYRAVQAFLKREPFKLIVQDGPYANSGNLQWAIRH